LGAIPALAAGNYKLEIVTRFSHGATVLKAPRVIAFDPVLTVA
jgi:hypothetical protein